MCSCYDDLRTLNFRGSLIALDGKAAHMGTVLTHRIFLIYIIEFYHTFSSMTMEYKLTYVEYLMSVEF